MALARIITRSHQCSRELALDLLARGYAVEIVSPDAIPENIADLELRVDSGPGDLLTASVEAHNGAHSASLEFVHHLKAPMVDFKRRPAQASEAISFSSAPVQLKAGPVAVSNVAGTAADLTKPSADDSQRASEPMRQVLPIVPAALVAPPPIAVPQALRIMFTEREEQLEPAVIAAVLKSKPERKVKSKPTPNNGNEVWFWRAAVSSGCVLTMAFVLSFGVQSRSIPSISDSAFSNFRVLANDSETHSFAKDANEWGTRDAAKSALANSVPMAQPALPGSSAATRLAAPATTPDKRKSETKPTKAAKSPAGPKVEAVASKRHHQTSRRHADDLVAPNTIVFFDRPGTQPALAKKAPRRDARSLRQGDGVIAASTVPSAKPVPKKR